MNIRTAQIIVLKPPNAIAAIPTSWEMTCDLDRLKSFLQARKPMFISISSMPVATTDRLQIIQIVIDILLVFLFCVPVYDTVHGLGDHAYHWHNPKGNSPLHHTSVPSRGVPSLLVSCSSTSSPVGCKSSECVG